MIRNTAVTLKRISWSMLPVFLKKIEISFVFCAKHDTACQENFE